MILHIISKSPYSHSAFTDALPFINNADKIMLIDEGVYAGIENTLYAKTITDNNLQCFALVDDIKTRGLSNIANSITIISMSDFVKLTFLADQTISWY